MKKFFSKIKEYGVFGFVKYLCKKWLGIQKQQEEIDTLYYFLNKYNDITKLPPTDNKDLRILQKCDAIMLAIFDKLCTKYGLTYWLDSGTLLGAVRHNGFIPWDDDLDICMPRKDYDRVISVLKTELQTMGFSIYEKEDETFRICLTYRHNETGIWCDIFPAEECNYDSDLSSFNKHIYPICRRYQRKYKIHNYSKRKNIATKKRIELLSLFTKGNNSCFLRCLDVVDYYLYSYDKRTVYPIKRILFEGFSFNVPNDYRNVLTVYYGKDYMSFPKSGVEHHGNKDGALSVWAKKNGINMQVVYNTMKELYLNME